MTSETPYRGRDRTTALHDDRLTAICAEVAACGAVRVADLGCGSGDLLLRLVTLPGIDALTGVDPVRDALERAQARLADLGQAGRVTLVHGGAEDCAGLLADHDCAVLSEVIEHIDPDRLAGLERAVFGLMRPRCVILTTPNADYNAILGVPPHRFRHPDHRFEWGRARFGAWAAGVAARNGYALRCRDLGGCHPEHGGASQMAVFARAG